MLRRKSWKQSESKRIENGERTSTESEEDEATDRYAGGCFPNVGAVNL